MARRKRLTPALSPLGGEAPPMQATPSRAPIAQVAGDAAALAAFEEVAGEMGRARDEGRLLLRLSRGEIRTDHLIRDRIAVDPEALEELKRSLRARGQQMPVEVVALEAGRGPRYGLISGWRRLLALAELEAETGDPRFGEVLALVRRPSDQAEAYLAMVEENEIRAGLSFYERARIVLKAVEAGVYESEKDALQSLFPAISYSKRSKIKSFVPLVAAFDAVLRHPARISERLGLALARGLAEDPDLADRLRAALEGLDPGDEAAEAQAIEACLTAHPAPAKAAGQGGDAPAEESRDAPEQSLKRDFEPVIQGLSMARGRHEVVLRGQRVTPSFIARLEAWLATLD
ncbi:ParB/RepB/Spo0J family partition protein [Pseudooceanicola nanhaiensis]|uniref:ParB/RepB/Spo0J family partition protein n=1 Tax=Pseudooceanicola nanhaiensis TaxID=375761 RepID=UPI0030097BB2